MKIENLLNAPLPVDTAEGRITIEPLGSITAPLTPTQLQTLRHVPFVALSDEPRDPFADVDDAALRSMVEAATGKKPSAKATRAALIKSLGG